MSQLVPRKPIKTFWGDQMNECNLRLQAGGFCEDKLLVHKGVRFI